MNLGIFLSSGESFADMSKSGQDSRFKHFYLKKFVKHFSKIYIFSYANEKVEGLPKNVTVVKNKYSIHRFLYGFLMPIVNLRTIIRCDVFRSYHLLGTLPAIVTKILLGKPFVFNYGYDYAEFAKVENKQLQIILIKLIYSPAAFLASAIIATTKEMQKQLPGKKTYFVPNGVDINFFKPKKKTELRTRLKIISIGRLVVQKNYANLIQAASLLPVNLIIVGSGPLKSELLRLAKKNKVNLKIIDKIDNLKLPAVLSNADVFILPSVVEGPNKAILEAMACCLAPIAADISGLRELIADGYNGLLTKTDTDSLRDSIIKLSNNRGLRRKLGQNARLKVEKDYNLEVLLEEEVQILIKTAKQ